MIELTMAQKTLLMSTSVKKTWTFEVYNGDTLEGEIPTSKMVADSFSIYEPLCSSSSLEVGAFESSVLKIKLADVDEYELKGKTLKLTLTASDGDTSVSFDMGSFTVDSSESKNSGYYYSVVAYDGMTVFDADVSDWFNSLFEDKETYTVKELRDSLCKYLSVEQEDVTLPNDGVSISQTVTASSLTGREVLKAICQINGCFGHFTRQGTLGYAYLGDDATITLTKGGEDHYKTSATHEDWTVKAYDCVKIIPDEVTSDADSAGGVYPADGGDNGLIISDNFLTYGMSDSELTALAQAVYAKIANHPYVVHSTPTRGRPWIEAGDKIEIQVEKNGVTSIITTYVLERTLSGFQGLADTYEAKGTEDATDTAVNSNTLITQLKNKTNVLTRTVDKLSSELTDLDTNLSTEIKQTADSLSAYATKKGENENKTFGYELTANGFTLTANGSDVFVCDENGVTVNGTINATSGTIGGLSIDEDSISSTNGNFSVTSDGVLKATGAIISGEIMAESGAIAGFAVGQKAGSKLTSIDVTASKTLASTSTDSSDYDIYAGETYYLITRTWNVTFSIDEAVDSDTNIIYSYSYGYPAEDSDGNYSLITVSGQNTATIEAGNTSVTVQFTFSAYGLSDSLAISDVSGSYYKSFQAGYITSNKASYDDKTEGVYIGADGIGLGSGTFYVTSDGELHAANTNLTGEINATSGTIGGLNIGDNGISSESGAFSVTSKGDLTAKSATLGKFTLGTRSTTFSYSDALYITYSVTTGGTFTTIISLNDNIDDLTEDITITWYCKNLLNTAYTSTVTLSAGSRKVSTVWTKAPNPNGATLQITGCSKSSFSGYSLDNYIAYNKSSYDDLLSGVFLGDTGIGVGSGFYASASGDLYAKGDAQVKSFTTSSASTSGGNIIPSASLKYSLGSDSYYWQVCYINNIWSSTVRANTMYASSGSEIEVNSSLIPGGKTTSSGKVYTSAIYTLGSESEPWDAVYAATFDTIVIYSSSDRRKKECISELSDRYSRLFDSLNPVRYKFRQRTRDVYHTGFIAQEVKDAMDAAGLTDEEFGGYYCNNDSYKLAYDDFIALCVNEIQKLKLRVETLKEEE
ncbi:MAG: tail fiber domain-containing protein [Clostridia bacterium]|nr:tail fiber domain-containing protein [Clostridia bacterium]